MGESGETRFFNAGADSIVDTDMDQGSAPVWMQENLKSVRQPVFLKVDLRYLEHDKGIGEICCCKCRDP